MTDDNFKAAIETRLADWLNTQEAAAPTDEAKLLLKRIQSLVLRAGKRSRPTLLHLTYQAYGGKHPNQLIDIGLAIELHHQFLLVHDDIMDNDTVRYDGPNMMGYYQADFLPQAPEIPPAMALLAGNLLYTYANQAILDHQQLSADQKVTLLALLQDVNLQVHAGQQLDILNIFALQPVITKDKLVLTDLLKTASYSVNLPMQMAAELLQLNPEERQKISTFAKSFGVLYQLVDDHSDYFPNSSSFNTHPKYRDFPQGKITYPLLVALETADSDDQAVLRKYIGQKDTPYDTMLQITNILEACGAKSASKQLIGSYFEQTEAALSKLAISSESKQHVGSILANYRV